ncbi:MAG: tRNA 2-thiocytidine(32) synthetase TtcA [Myxococcales bacterium]|nr:tRNA 2-thiocytidine(32) synthetase TtcA [Myxococcales bacterium]
MSDPAPPRPDLARPPARDQARDLARSMGRCIRDFGLVEEGDRIMVCLSGGKDSYTLLELLERARRRAPVRFELIAVHLDQGHPGYDGRPLERWLHEQGYEHRILREDTYEVVTANVPEGKTYCSLCSRLRRGVLARAAAELGCTKIALGHHADDAIETLMLNLMFTGSLGAMPPKLVSEDGSIVIRPLLYCQERDIAAYAAAAQFPILPCDLCGSQENLWRKQVKQLLVDLEARVPQLRQSMLAALGNVRGSHLLDPHLLAAAGVPIPEGAAPSAPLRAPITGEDVVGSTPSAPSPATSARRLPLVSS